MLRFLPILIGLVGLLIIGYTDVVLELARLEKRAASTLAYHQRWQRFAQDMEQAGGQPQDYVWLALHQPAMSAELGGEDVITYQAPFGRYASNNYPLLANTVASFRTGQAEPRNVQLVDHLLITHGGVLANREEKVRADLNNPLALLRHGLQLVLSLPLLVLAWSGLLSAASLQRARESALFRILQLAGGLVIVFSAFETAVIGWPAFASQVRHWFPH